MLKILVGLLKLDFRNKFKIFQNVKHKKKSICLIPRREYRVSLINIINSAFVHKYFRKALLSNVLSFFLFSYMF